MRISTKSKNTGLTRGNIVYIQAAVFENTGIKVPLHQLFILLLEERLITRSQISQLEVPNLNKYGSSFVPTEKIYDTTMIPVDVVIKDWPGLFTDRRVNNEQGD
jgi:hypothetical protein